MRHLLFLAGAPLAVSAAALAFSCSAVPDPATFGAGGAHASSGAGNPTSTGAGNPSGTGSTTTGVITGGGDAAVNPTCTGLQCVAQTDNCAGTGKSLTTITGTVYDPAGKLPIYNVYVYIPNTTPDPIHTGDPTCTQCEAPASGSPVIGVSTDAKGNFTLVETPTSKWGVPSGTNIPLVLQVGKWRRQVVIPSVAACGTTAIPDPPTPAAKLRLPAKSSEGDMPLIAFTSGCDPAECFLRNVGIDDSEFVAPGSPTGHVHFYTGLDSSGSGSASSVNGGNQPADTYAWWTNPANLLKYDIVFNACECNPNDRNMAGVGDAYGAMDKYLSGGGRVFTTHYYYNWFAPPTGKSDLNGVVNWALPEGFTEMPFSTFFIDMTFPKGAAFGDWLFDNGITPTHGLINLTDTRWDMNTTTPLSSRWIYNANSPPDPMYATMYMSFNTPTTVPVANQCGRAVFSDVHLSGTSDDSTFPNECANADPGGSHAGNEKALEFLFFDLSSCVQDNSKAPPPPPPT